MIFGKECQSLLTILSLFSLSGCAVHQVNETPSLPVDSAQVRQYATFASATDNGGKLSAVPAVPAADMCRTRGCMKIVRGSARAT